MAAALGEEIAQEGPVDPAVCGVEILVKRVVRAGVRDGDSTQRTGLALLGFDPSVNSTWPSQAEVAQALGLSRGRIGQIVGKLATRWAKDPAIGFVRTSIVELLDASGGIQSVDELAEAILTSRGSSDDEPMRTRAPRGRPGLGRSRADHVRAAIPGSSRRREGAHCP